MRSHPPSLFTLVRRTAKDECGLDARTRVLCAVSGGPDSMALLHVLYMLLDRGLLAAVTAHGVDHGLREDARAELDLAASFAQKLGIRFDRTVVAVAAGGNLQARARDARWAALEAARAAAGADVIATGHHADDRAETVLLRLLRGAPALGLAVLPPREGRRVRPLIRARRTDIDAHLGRHGVPFSNDPSNDATRFSRTRVRKEVLPLLESLSPAIVTHLCRLADELVARSEEGATGIGEGEESGGEKAAPAWPPGIDPRVESRRTLEAIARARSDPKKFARARVLLKGGLVLSEPGAQSRQSRAQTQTESQTHTPPQPRRKKSRSP